jgi:hypothetical protein
LFEELHLIHSDLSMRGDMNERLKK